MSKSSKFDFLAGTRQAVDELTESKPAEKTIQISESPSTQNSESVDLQKPKSSDTSIATSFSATPEKQAQKRRGRPPGKRSNPDYEQVTAYIRSETYLSIKKALLDDPQSRDFSTLLEELLVDWLTS